MKRILLSLAAAATLGALGGCAAYADPYGGYGPGYGYGYGEPAVSVGVGVGYYGGGYYNGYYGRDRDGDGVSNRYDRDRDGDGVRNARDPRPNNPRR
ncbi:hypothetical protein WG902_21420 [Ramlibacter sp. PS3R-8]|uniref:hypothetical protein n=1 Tax=Ramlibacter sp. PS3R-8 TaxID=3133437 RepID=UPI0030AB2ACD